MDQLSESVFILKSHWTALEKRDDFFKNDNNKKQTAQKKKLKKILPLHFQWPFTVSLCSAGIWRRALLKAEKKRILLSDWGILSQQIAQKWKLWSTSTAILLNSLGYEVVKSKEVEKVKVRDRGPISRSSPHPSKKPSFFWTQVFFDYGSSSSASLLSSAMDQKRFL